MPVVSIGLGSLINPGRKQRKTRRVNMARRRRTIRIANPRRRRRASVRRRRNVASRRYVARKRNPFFARRRRRVNPRRYLRRRRRNPGLETLTSGTTGKVLGVILGATVTSQLSKFIPPQFSTGIIGYLSKGLVAYLQGYAAGKVTKNPSFGTEMAAGGYAYVALHILNDFLPTFSPYIPIGVKGMGTLAPSSFYVPQTLGNRFNTFELPPAVSGALIPATGNNNAGMGNVRGRRMR